MADASRTWTNTYRGPDDATMIGAFARDAAAATAAGWRPAEQQWGTENGARVLTVRYERAAAPESPADSTATARADSTAAARAASPAWARADSPSFAQPVGAAAVDPAPVGAAPSPSRQPPRYVPTSHSPQVPGTAASAAARPPQDAGRSAVRSGVASIGGLLFAVGAGLVVLGPGGNVETAGVSTAAIGVGAWLTSRVAQRVARLRAGIRRPLGGPASTLGLGIVSTWLIVAGIARLPLPSIASGIVASPSTAPMTEAPAETKAPVETAVPEPTPRPIPTPQPIPTPAAPAFTIDAPEDGDVVDSAAVDIAGSAAPGALVTCVRPPQRWTATADRTGHWTMAATLEPGANTVTCEVTGDVAPRQSVTVVFAGSGGGGAMFTLSSGGGPDPFVFGPFELPAGSWQVSWIAEGQVGCAARFEIVPDPETGTPDVAFGGAANSRGGVSGVRSFDTSAVGGHVIHAQVACDSWTITLGPAEAAPPSPTP